MSDVHDSQKQLIRELLSKPDEITAILQSNSHQLTPDFFTFLAQIASELRSKQHFIGATAAANLGIEAAAIAGAKHDAYRLVELRGRVEMDQNHLDAAINSFETARMMAKELLDAGDNIALIGFVSSTILLADREAFRDNYAKAREVLAEARLTSYKLQSAWGELWTIVNLAAICLKQGDYDQALKYALHWTDVLKRLSTGKTSNSIDAVAALPPQSQLYDLLASLAREFYYEKDDYNSASTAAKQAIQLDPTREDVYPLLGFCQIRLKQFSEAIETWKRLVDLDPDKPVYHLNYSHALQIAGKLEEALFPASEAIRLMPSNQRYYFHRSQILMGLDRYEAAISDLKRIIELFETGTHEQDPAPVKEPRSRAEWERSLSAQDLAFFAISDLGSAYLKLSRTEEARQISTRMINDNDESFKAMGYYQLGRLESSLGNKTEALQAYAKTLELKPGDFFTRADRVEIYISQNDIENAVKDLSVLAQQDKALDLAIKKLTDILERQPDSYQARKWLGFAYLQSFRPSKAHENLSLAIEHLPDDANLYLWRGLSKIMAGLTEDEQEWDNSFSYKRLWEAIDDLGNAVRLEPENVQAVESYKWLVDRVTAEPTMLLGIRLSGDEPNGLFTLFPQVREPLNSFWLSGRLSAVRRWAEAVEELKLAQSGFQAAGFPVFSARVDIGLADNSLRLYRLQEALDYITRAEQYFTLVTQPLSANLRVIAQQTSERSRQRLFSETANPELEFMGVYAIGFDLLWQTARLIKAETLSRLNDPRAIEALGNVDDFVSDVEKTLKSGISYQALMAIVMLLRDAEQYEKAIEIVKRIEPFAPTDKDRMGLYNTAGTLYEMAGDYDVGMTYFKKICEMIETTGEAKDYLPIVVLNMASNHIHENRPQEALDYLNKVDIAKEARSFKETYNYYMVMAQALVALKRNEEAQQAILKGVAIIEAERLKLRSFDSRITWQGEQENTYRFAVAIAVTNNDRLTAFELMEKSRARAFVDQLATGHLTLPESEKPLEQIEDRILEQQALLSRLLNSLETRGPDFIDYEVVGKLQNLSEGIKLFEDDAGTRLSREKIEDGKSQLTKALERLRARMEEARLLNAANTYGAVPSFPELRQLLSN